MELMKIRNIISKGKELESEQVKKPLYIIVSEEHAFSPEIKKEIEKIKSQEDYILIDDVPSKMPRGISKKREIRVCGCFGEYCVSVQYWYLKNKGHPVEKYIPACQSAFARRISTMGK